MRLMREYSLDVLSIILIMGVIQGIIFIFLLLFKSKNNISNRIFVLLLMVLIWFQMEFLSIRQLAILDFDLFYGTRYGAWLALGPLLYLYILSYTSQNFRITWKHLLSFFPFIFITLILPLVLNDLVPERGKYYGMLAVIKFPKLGINIIQITYVFIFLFQFIHASIYIILSFHLTKKFSQVVKNNFSNIHYKWLISTTFIIFIFLISSIGFFFILFFSNFYERWMDHIYVIPVTFIIYWMAYNVFKQPEILQKNQILMVNSIKYEKSSLSVENAELIHSNLLNLLKQEKPFLDNELKLSSLSNRLSVSPHHLSQVINEKLQVSFYDLINRYRVEEAKEKLIKFSGKKSFLEIAHEVGFNNKVSFNNYFKKYTGMTPTDFTKSKYLK